MASDFSLMNHGFEDRYRRKQGHEMLNEFYVPLLKESSTYDRVSGYFSSSVLKHASAGFSKFCKNPNLRAESGIPKFRLIVGARLNADDEQAVLHLQDPSLALKISDSLVREIENISATKIRNNTTDSL